MKPLHVMHSRRPAMMMRRSAAMNSGQIVVLAVMVAAVLAACFAVAWAATWVAMELSRLLS